MGKKSPKQLFTKLFYRYTAMLVCIVLALAVYFISSTRSRILETNLHYRDLMEEEASAYVEECSQTTGYILSELYQSSDILTDLLAYFKNSSQDYQKYRLDTYMSLPSLVYEGFDDYAEKALQSYPEIISIEMISYDHSEVTSCLPEGKVYVSQNGKERLEDVANGTLSKEGVLAFEREIRDPETLTGAGCMIINFNTQKLEKIQAHYDSSELLVCGADETVVYLSDEEMNPGPFIEEEREGAVKDTSKAYVEKSVIKDYTIYALADKKKAAHVPRTTFLAVFSVGLLVILIGVLFIRVYLIHLTKRLNEIIDGMHSVKTGDLSIRLRADKNGDELDVISAQFNEMCQELDRYIQKSYLAEIQQKNAEMEVLQNQINPHFLYNTLEAIRMKAICNGDREVGKMLYSMSVIFRSQLKDGDIISLIQEIHYCKKYLELFEYRYQGKFTSKVECPEELMEYPVMKFILQPIVENYFVHGIQTEQEGNFLSVWAEKKPAQKEAVPRGKRMEPKESYLREHVLLLHVEDNGKGMSHEELQKKNEELQSDTPVDKKSVGISNVNSRIRAVYGDGYGVTLEAREGGGLHVIVKIGLSEGEEK